MNITDMIEQEFGELCDFVIAKNEAYGKSLFEPVGIFSKLDAMAKVDVRIDDKLSKLKKGWNIDSEDAIKDLIGYLVLRRVLMKLEKKENG